MWPITIPRRKLNAADVRLTPGVSSPVYAYGINLLPAERVAEEVMKLSTQLTHEKWETAATFTLDDLDQRFLTLLKQLEADGICQRDVDYLPIITKEQWLQAQLVTIQKMAKGDKL